MIKKIALFPALILLVICLATCTGIAQSKNLKLIFIRHGEKPADGDNLSCVGLNRALKLPEVLKAKFGIPDRVPGCDPVKHNYKSNGLNYINTSCFTLPKAPSDPALAAQCVPFVGNGTPANPQFPGTCANLLGNAGRNGIEGPSLKNFDFSVYKNFALTKISESSRLQFRAEFFNILNHANFGVPAAFTGGSQSLIFNGDGTSSGAGQLTGPTVTKPRDIQLALKLIW